MSKILYIAANVDAETRQKIEKYEVDLIFVEEVCHLDSRPKFREAVKSLKDGDEFILASFSSSVRGLIDLALLIELCEIIHVRLISINDEIDTHDKLFLPKSTLSLLSIIGTLPQNIISFNKFNGEDELQIIRPVKTGKREERENRDRLVIALYLAGHSIELISRKAGIKYSSIYNILTRNGVGRKRIIRSTIS